MDIKKFFLIIITSFLSPIASGIARPPALYNFSLTCYINALIQNLFNLPEIIENVQDNTSLWGTELNKLFKRFEKGTDAEVKIAFDKIGVENGSVAERYKALVTILRNSIFTGDLSKKEKWSKKIVDYEKLDPYEPTTYRKLDEDIGAFLGEKFQITATFTSNKGEEETKVISRKLTSFKENEINQITESIAQKEVSVLDLFFPAIEKASAYEKALDEFIENLKLDRNAGDSGELLNSIFVSDEVLTNMFLHQLQINYHCFDGGKYNLVLTKLEAATLLLVGMDKSKKENSLAALLQKKVFGIENMAEYKDYKDIPALIKKTKEKYVREFITQKRDSELTALNNEIEQLKKEEELKSIYTVPCSNQTRLVEIPLILAIAPKRVAGGYFYIQGTDKNNKTVIDIANIDLKNIPEGLNYELPEFFDVITTIPLMLNLKNFLSDEASKKIKKTEYELVGGILHTGGYHYYAIVHSFRDGFWYLCNDCPYPSITKISQENALDRLSGKAKRGFATLLFYRKKDVVEKELKKTAKTERLFVEFAQALSAV